MLSFIMCCGSFIFMKYVFYAKGHANVLGTHRNTLELTSDSELSRSGDCIVGVACDFDLAQIQKMLSFDRLRMTMSVEVVDGKDVSDFVEFNVNKDFNSFSEIVLRLGDFVSDRTLGTGCSKSAKMLSRELINRMVDPSARMEVVLESLEE